MGRGVLWYVASSFVLAVLVDVVFYLGGWLKSGGLTAVLAAFAWGVLRMYTPAVSVLLAAGAGALKEALRLDKRVAVAYFAAPLVVYLALAFYHLLAAVGGFLTSRPIAGVVESQRAIAPWLTPEVYMALTLWGGYFAAVTINALFALGEEVGWRGFL
ncbi:MAG: hypothetical protein ACK4SY_10375 [Pyrobaculum sp.]